MRASYFDDLAAPFEADRLIEIRTSAMKRMPGLKIMSGIDKELRTVSMKVDKMGLEGDEHDPTFHGGLDKAILGCKYPSMTAVNIEQTNTRIYSIRLLLALSILARILSRTCR